MWENSVIVKKKLIKSKNFLLQVTRLISTNTTQIIVGYRLTDLLHIWCPSQKHFIFMPVWNCPPWLKVESGRILVDRFRPSVIKMLSCVRQIQVWVRVVYGSKYLNEIRSIPCLKIPFIDALHILGEIPLIDKTYSVLRLHGFLPKLTWIPSYLKIKSIQWLDGVRLILRRNPVNAVSHSSLIY